MCSQPESLYFSLVKLELKANFGSKSVNNEIDSDSDTGTTYCTDSSRTPEGWYAIIPEQ